MAAPTLQQGPITVGDAGVSQTIQVTTASTTAVGDVLVAIHANDYYAAAALGKPTSPSGVGTWTDIGSVVNAGTERPHMRAAWAVVTTAGARTVSATSTNDACHGLAVYVFRGADQTNPIDASGSAFNGTTRTTSFTLTAISPTTADACLIAAYLAGSGAFAQGNLGTPSGMTGHTEMDMTYSTMAVNHQFLSASGSTGTRVASSTQSDYFAGMMIAVKGASASTTEKEGTDSATLSDDTGTFPWNFSSKTDTPALTDTAALQRQNALTDSATITDSVVLQRQNALTDSATLTEATAELQRQNSLTDSGTLTESVSIVRNYLLTDTATETDTAAISGTLPASESYGLTDASELFVLTFKTGSDSASLTDTTTTSTRTSALSDTSSLTDSNTRANSSSVNDSATVSDSSTIVRDLNLDLSDSSSISDSASLSTSRSATDSASFTDLGSSPGNWSVLDAGTILESVTSITVTQSRSDTATLTETNQTAQSATDSHTFTDVSSVLKNYFSALVDSASSSDSSSLAGSAGKTDTATTSDSSSVTTNQSRVDLGTLSETARINVITSDTSAVFSNNVTGRTLAILDSLNINDTQFFNAWMYLSDEAFATDMVATDRGAIQLPTNYGDLAEYEPPTEYRPARLIAQDIFTKKFVHWDLPVGSISIKKTISGPQIISAIVSTEIESLRDLNPPLEPDRTWIHFEEDGQIRASGILLPFTDDNKGKTRTIEAEGPSTYPHWRYYQDEAYQGIQVDPADMIRKLWDHVQDSSYGDLGVIIDDTLTPVRIGTEPENVEFETGEGEQVSFVAGPYALNFWSVTNCGDEIDKLCKETPIEYLEREAWNSSKTDVLHYIDLFYPRAGRRRDDLGFREGENFIDLIPAYSENKEIYASRVIVVGAGDGPDAIRETVSAVPNPARLLKEVVIQKEDITNKERALAIAQFEFRRRALSKYEIQSITIDTTHINAPFGSFQEGDDILVEGVVQYIGQIADLHRIVSYTYNPLQKQAILDLKPSESFDYGALKVDPLGDS